MNYNAHHRKPAKIQLILGNPHVSILFPIMGSSPASLQWPPGNYNKNKNALFLSMTSEQIPHCLRQGCPMQSLYGLPLLLNKESCPQCCYCSSVGLVFRYHNCTFCRGLYQNTHSKTCPTMTQTLYFAGKSMLSKLWGFGWRVFLAGV